MKLKVCFEEPNLAADMNVVCSINGVLLGNIIANDTHKYHKNNYTNNAHTVLPAQ